MNTTISAEQLRTYFAGQATAFDKQQIDEWARDTANQEHFYGELIRWEQQHLQGTPDANAAFARHRARMQAQPAQAPTPTSQRSSRWLGTSRSWVLAASVSVTALVGTLWLCRDLIRYQTYRTAYGQTQSLTLPDGSQVMLNANSSLRIPRWRFGEEKRTVRLTGEAQFSITHKANHQPFVVETNQPLAVTVLGTEFAVYSRRRGAMVTLLRGKVRLDYRTKQGPKQLLMTPGDHVRMAPGGQVNRYQTRQPERAVAWTQHRFVFDRTPLTEVQHLFAEQFGLVVEIPDAALAHLTLSGSFTAHTADELLDLLAETANLNYRKLNNHVVIGH